MTSGSESSITVLQAVGVYADTIKSKDNRGAIDKELSRFVNWCGRQRVFSELSPSEIGAYADQIGGSGTTPLATEKLQAIRAFLSFARKKGLIDRNLATHVRIRKSKTRGGGPSERTVPDVVELTAEGHRQLLDQLEKLKSERAPLALQIRTAAADKDVRENVPLEAAREQLGHVESRIASIEAGLKEAVIIDTLSRKRAAAVRLGVQVYLKDLGSGRETHFTLVHRNEANPLEGRISDASPLGQVLMGQAVGQEVEAETPRGKVRYRILKVTS